MEERGPSRWVLVTSWKIHIYCPNSDEWFQMWTVSVDRLLRETCSFAAHCSFPSKIWPFEWGRIWHVCDDVICYAARQSVTGSKVQSCRINSRSVRNWSMWEEELQSKWKMHTRAGVESRSSLPLRCIIAEGPGGPGGEGSHLQGLISFLLSSWTGEGVTSWFAGVEPDSRFPLNECVESIPSWTLVMRTPRGPLCSVVNFILILRQENVQHGCFLK